MACRRGGCAGVAICESSIDCISFEQDAGNGCTGLASGSSRLQFNALGELEICSNVGGVCSCESVCPCPILEAANLDAAIVYDITDATGAAPVQVPGFSLNFTMAQPGNATIHFSHHLRANSVGIPPTTGIINVIPMYSIDGAPPVRFGPVHAFALKSVSEEQHMSAMTAENLAAGAHTIDIWHEANNLFLNPGDIIRWNQSELLVTWLDY